MTNNLYGRARVALQAMVLTFAIGLVGCSGADGKSGDELYGRGREVNLTFKRAVAEVQSQVTETRWESSQYGNVPSDCGGGHFFELTRTTPAGWGGFGGDQRAAAQKLGDWLNANGWSDVHLRTYEGDVSTVVVQARKKDAYVERLDVNLDSGAADVAILRADSTCEPGDADALMTELYPGWPTDTVTHEPLPTQEAPGDTPIFGFTEEGKPRPDSPGLPDRTGSQHPRRTTTGPDAQAPRRRSAR